MSWPNLPAEMWLSKVCAIQSETNPLVLCSNAVDRSRFGFPEEHWGKLNRYYLCLVDMSGGHALLTVAGYSSGTRSNVDGRAPLLSRLLVRLSTAVRRLWAASSHGPVWTSLPGEECQWIIQAHAAYDQRGLGMCRAASGDNKKLSLWWRIASLSFPVEPCSFFIKKGEALLSADLNLEDKFEICDPVYLLKYILVFILEEVLMLLFCFAAFHGTRCMHDSGHFWVKIELNVGNMLSVSHASQGLCVSLRYNNSCYSVILQLCNTYFVLS